MADVLIDTSQNLVPLLNELGIESLDQLNAQFWGNAKPPTSEELEWIKTFGQYKGFEPDAGKLSKRVTVEIANLKEATRIIVVYHYLHRGRTMAQMPYWVKVDGNPVGVLLYAYPRLSVPLHGIEPMNLLELARLWIHPSVQGQSIVCSKGREHAVSVASCAIAAAHRRIRGDWYAKYPKLPDIDAIVSWADDVHHEGTIYRASNFKEMGKSGGAMHGSRKRINGGSDKLNPDYANVKTLFMYPFEKRLSESEKRHLDLWKTKQTGQLPLLFG